MSEKIKRLKELLMEATVTIESIKKDQIIFDNIVINPECTGWLNTLQEMSRAAVEMYAVKVYTNQHMPEDRLVLRHGLDVVGWVEIKETSAANAG